MNIKIKKNVKKIGLIVFSISFMHCLTIFVEGMGKKPDQAVASFPFYIYADKNTHYSPSGWMGDYRDLKINESYKKKPKEGKNCVEISYSAEKRNDAGWAGIYWQNPAQNWGTMKGGYNLTGAKKLTFWARGEKGNEYISEFKIGGITEQTHAGDSDSASIGPISLSRKWTRYEIDLEGKDLSYIIGGFAFSASSEDNPTGFKIYLDEIKYE